MNVDGHQTCTIAQRACGGHRIHLGPTPHDSVREQVHRLLSSDTTPLHSQGQGPCIAPGRPVCPEGLSTHLEQRLSLRSSSPQWYLSTEQVVLSGSSMSEQVRNMGKPGLSWWPTFIPHKGWD